MSTQGRWQSTGAGRMRLVPGAEPTPEEKAADAARFADMIASRRAPSPRVWNPESVVQAAGRPVSSRAKWKDMLKRNNWVEIDSSERDNESGDTRTASEHEQKKERARLFAESMAEAKADLASGKLPSSGPIQSGARLVQPATPYTPLPAPVQAAPPEPPDFRTTNAPITRGGEQTVTTADLMAGARNKVIADTLARDKAR